MVERDKTKTAQDKAKAEKTCREKAENENKILIKELLEKDVSVENIAKILGITEKAVEKIINKTKLFYI